MLKYNFKQGGAAVSRLQTSSADIWAWNTVRKAAYKKFCLTDIPKGRNN